MFFLAFLLISSFLFATTEEVCATLKTVTSSSPAKTKRLQKNKPPVFENGVRSEAMDSDGGERWGGDEKTWRAPYQSESSAARAQ
jgi:hypothetical protein